VPVFDTYASRLRRAETAGQPDVYTYDELPVLLRKQISRIFTSCIGPGYRHHEFANSAPPHARPRGRNPCHAFLTDSRIGVYSNHCVTGIREPDMLTGMTEQDWLITLEVFDAAQSNRGEPGHDDRKFLEAIHYFTVHSITWRALPKEFGNWNSVWKRFWRLSRSGVFEAFFQMLAEFSETAHLIQFFDSTTARAHVSAAGAKGGSITRHSAARAADSRPKSISKPISTAALSTST